MFGIYIYFWVNMGQFESTWKKGQRGQMSIQTQTLLRGLADLGQRQYGFLLGNLDDQGLD